MLLHWGAYPRASLASLALGSYLWLPRDAYGRGNQMKQVWKYLQFSCRRLVAVRVLPLRWGRLCRLGELVRTSSTFFLTARRAQQRRFIGRGESECPAIFFKGANIFKTHGKKCDNLHRSLNSWNPEYDVTMKTPPARRRAGGVYLFWCSKL